MDVKYIYNISNKSILPTQENLKEKQFFDKHKMLLAQLLEYDNSKAIRKLQYLAEAKLRNAAPDLTVRNRIDNCFPLSNKSAQESADVFQEAYRQQLLGEAKLRNATPDLTLRNEIDKSFKIANKSAKASAEVFMQNDKKLISKIHKFFRFGLGKQALKCV